MTGKKGTLLREFMASGLNGGVTLIEPVQEQQDDGRDYKAEDEAEETPQD